MTTTLQQLTVLILALCLTSCGNANSTLMTKHMSKDRRGEAQERWDNVRGDVKLRLAREHLDSNRVDEAEKVIEQAAAVTPNDPQVYVLLARLRLEQGRLAEARQAVTKASSLHGDDPEIPYLAGIIAQRYGESELAVDCYLAAVKKSPNNPGYVLALGETLVALGRNIDALELIESRINDFDSNAPLRMLAARVCRGMGLKNTAVRHVREALRVTPDDAFVVADCAQILASAERHQDVVNLLRPILERADKITLTPDTSRLPAATPTPVAVTPSMRRCIATAYLALNKPADALNALEPAMDGLDVDDATRLLYARSALDAGDLQAADHSMKQIHATGESSLGALLLSATIALDSQDSAAALNLISRATELDNDAPEVRALSEKCAMSFGRHENAESLTTNASCEAHSGATSIDANPASTIPSSRWHP
ncbi:MAG: tetratricopeptide repeat protein [Planctomycetota bacterium]